MLRSFPRSWLFAAVSAFSSATLFADSLGAGVSTDYTAVINFDRADYYVDSRFKPATPTAALGSLETSILFHPLEPDAAGNIVLPANFSDSVARMRAASPNAGYTLGLGSLTAISGNAAAISNFNTQLATLTSTYGFTGVDIDWEDMPGKVSAAAYGATVKAVANPLRAANLVVSTSHATGAQYQPYVAQISGAVDFLNLQFYYSVTGGMNMATFRNTLNNYLNQGLQASQIRIGLPSYGMVNPNVTSTADKWRSWSNLIAAGVDVTTLNQWTDPKNGETYYFSSLELIREKMEYAMENGYAGVFSWEITQDRDYSNPLSVYALMDSIVFEGVPTLELNDSNTGTGKLGSGTVTLGSGAVLNNGLLRFDRSAAATHVNRIDGYGRVEVTGSGAVTLTGANTYSGGTLIEAGSTLNVGNGGVSGSLGTGEVTNEGTLTFNHSDSAVLDNRVTGGGRFNKTGTGVLTLSGEDKSMGSLQVTRGTLISEVDLDVSGEVLLGVGASAVFRQTGGVVNITTGASGWGVGFNLGHKAGGSAVYALEGGTLNVLNAAMVLGAGGGSSGTLNLTGGTANLKGLSFGTSASDSATVNLSGGARLNLGASGIANAVGAPTGARSVNLGAGTVGALANWSSSVAMRLTDAVAGVVIDTRDAADGVTARHITLSGALTGVGKLSKTGAGVLTLSGANTYSGGIFVGEGSLVTGHLSSLGSGSVTVASGGVLVIGNGPANSVVLGSGATLLIEAGGVLQLGSITSAITLVGASGYDFAGVLDLNGLFDDVAGTQAYTLISGSFSGGSSERLTGITGYDATRVSAEFTGGVLTVTAIPEPSTYGLLGAGAVAVGALVRRRRLS